MMIIAHVLREGGEWILGPKKKAPIRLYEDGHIEDDIFKMFSGKKIRERLRPKELAELLKMCGVR